MGSPNSSSTRGSRCRDIRDIYITHHHPDHNIELGTLIYFAWYAGMDTPLQIYGPPPLKMITKNYMAAEKPDVDIWLDDIGHKPMPPIHVHEVSKAEVVTQNAEFKVTSALVNHPPVVPALAYRFDFPDRSIVFSGDTTPMESVAQLAKGADVLVHEAIYVKAMEKPRRRAASRASRADRPSRAIPTSSSPTSCGPTRRWRRWGGSPPRRG